MSAAFDVALHLDFDPVPNTNRDNTVEERRLQRRVKFEKMMQASAPVSPAINRSISRNAQTTPAAKRRQITAPDLSPG
ncbi:MAG: hypothetical protein ABR880_14515 [Candidatus Sulfotelmatobacter sp.]